MENCKDLLLILCRGMKQTLYVSAHRMMFLKVLHYLGRVTKFMKYTNFRFIYSFVGP